MAEVETTPTPFLMPNGGHLVTLVSTYQHMELLLAGEQLDRPRPAQHTGFRQGRQFERRVPRSPSARSTQGVSPHFFLKSANRNAATQPPSTTKYSQAFIWVPGGALDLQGGLGAGNN